MKLRLPTVRLKTAATVLMALQGLGGVALAGYLLTRGEGAPPQEAFIRLRDAVVKGGVEAGLEELDNGVWVAGLSACRRDACIRDRYDGDRRRYESSPPDSRKKMCLGYEGAKCPESAIRGAVSQVLLRLPLCKIVDSQVVGERARLKVACAHGATGFIHLARGRIGWKFAGEHTYPGFLPRLYRSGLALGR